MKLIPCLLFLFLLIAGCGSNHSGNMDVFQYKDSYIGDNSAVGNIIHQLPDAESFKQVMLQTKKEPYGMVIQYGDATGNIKTSIINNASYLFVLVKNAEWITFDYPNLKFTLTRQQLQQWYGEDLSKMTNEKDLEKLIQTGIRAGTQIFHLKQVDEPDPSIVYTREGEHFHLYLETDDAAALAEALKARGVNLVKDVHETPWGTREFVIEDDQGHTLYFGEDLTGRT